jgi:hypothetical protein
MKNYLQYSSEPMQQEDFNKFIKLVNKNGKKSVIAFYSQKFTPELITETFDGWEYQKEDEVLINGRIVIELFYESEPRYNSVIINDEGFVMAAPMPRTLDEFITLCQQTGIELKERG